MVIKSKYDPTVAGPRIKQQEISYWFKKKLRILSDMIKFD